MKLDRNLNADGRGKYGLIKNRRLAEIIEAKADGDWAISHEVQRAIQTLEAAGVIDWGTTADTEFFVMRLRDRNAASGLYGYGDGARGNGDEELADEVDALADRAGPYHPNPKVPD